MKLKNILLTALAFTTVFTTIAVTNKITFAKDESIILLLGSPYVLNKDKLTTIDENNLNITPFLDSNNSSLIPLRFVSEAFSAKVDWKDETKTITITTDKNTSVLKIGSKELTVNNKKITMNTEPVLKNNTVYIPLRELGENILSKKIEWDKTQLISISDSGNILSNLSSSEKNELLKKLNNPVQQQNTGIKAVGTKENYVKILNEILEYQNKFATNDILYDSAVPEASRDSTEKSISDRGAAGAGHSETNVQVEGVDEADIIKTDGEYIYYITNNNLYIVNSKNPSDLSITKILDYSNEYSDKSNTSFYPREMFLDKNTLTVIGNYNTYDNPSELLKSRRIYFNNKTKVLIYDISSKNNIKKIKDFHIEGNYSSSRKINNQLYLITNNYFYEDITTYNATTPKYYDSVSNTEKEIPYDRIYYFPESKSSNMINISSIDVSNPSKDANVKSYLGSSDNIYCSNENLYIAVSEYDYSGVYKPANTKIYKFNLNKGDFNYAASTSVAGTILNQFSMDEHNNYFRIATTINDWRNTETSSTNNLFILDKNLSVVGKITDIANNEQIKSTRFLGNKIYIVTFEEVDPLFVIDASIPSAPKILGELKIPGYSTYLHPYDENHIIGFGFDTKTRKYDSQEFIVNAGLKMALFDVSDVTKPKELFVEKIGDSGTYSELINNHKALMFDKQRNILAFPANIVKEKTEIINDQKYYGSINFNGALVYNISLSDGFKLKHQITNSEYHDDYEGAYINRIIYIGNAIFTASNGRIKSTDYNTGKTLSTVSLPTSRNNTAVPEIDVTSINN